LAAVVGLIVLAVVSMRVGWLLVHGKLWDKAAVEARGDVKPPIPPGAPSEESGVRRGNGPAQGPPEGRNTAPHPPTPVPVQPPVPPRPPTEDVASASVIFEKQVLPILQTRCALCHNTVKRRGGLNVLSMASLLEGGESGPAVTPGSLDDSVLWETLETDKMPPTQNKIPPAEKAIIRKWILTGAKDSRGTKVPAKP
jgi:hypothetical protein